MYNILLLGGSGFIGKNIVESFIGDESCKLIVVTRNLNLARSTFLTEKDIIIEVGELSNSDFIESIIDLHEINVIIHLASGLIPSSSDDVFYEGMDNVVIPTFKLIDYISNKEIKFIFFSSGGTIYGDATSIINESHTLNPINNYGFSKLLIEKYINFKVITSKLNSFIIRPSNVYGRHQSFDGNQGFISVAISKIYHKLPIEIWGDGNSVRDYIHINDVVSAVKKIIFNSIAPCTLNLSTGVGKSLIEIIAIIEKNLDQKAIIHFNNKRKVDADSIILDNSKLKSIFPMEFIAIEEGIKNHIQYFKTV
jgi:UDP-glucose 4-epimerase